MTRRTAKYYKYNQTENKINFLILPESILAFFTEAPCLCCFMALGTDVVSAHMDFITTVS